MKSLTAGLGMLLAGVLAVAAPERTTQSQPQPQPTAVVGTFDSRAIATAWIRSAEFGRYIQAQQKDLRQAIDRAREAGDRRLAAELEAIGPAMQHRVHQQGFSTAPVDEILARISDKLPAIAQQAGVDGIVSKWQLTWRKPGAQFVDVTDLLVAEFQPDAKTLEIIARLVESEPQPLEQIKNH